MRWSVALEDVLFGNTFKGPTLTTQESAVSSTFRFY